MHAPVHPHAYAAADVHDHSMVRWCESHVSVSGYGGANVSVQLVTSRASLEYLESCMLHVVLVELEFLGVTHMCVNVYM